MSDRILKICFGVILFIGVSTILGALFIYWSHSHLQIGADIDTNTFGIFGDFIGGFVGTLFNIAATVLIWITYKSQKVELEQTRKLLEKQISISYKPEICVKDKYIQSSITTFSHGNPVSFNIGNVYSEGVWLSDHISLINIGVAPAKQVNYRWEFDTLKCLDFLSKYKNEKSIQLSLEKDGHSLKVYTNDEEMANYLFITPFLSFSRFDVLLPYKEHTDEKSLFLPLPYMLIFLLSFDNTADRINFPDPKFPPLQLHIAYQDIESKTHIKIFNINIELHSASTSRTSIEHKFHFDLKISGSEQK